MTRSIPWNRRLSTRLGAILLIIAGLSGVIIALNMQMLRALREHSASMRLTAQGPAMIHEMLYLVDELRLREGPEREAVHTRLSNLIERMERRYQVLREGDPGEGLVGVRDATLVEDLRERETEWRERIRPLLERAVATGDAASVTALEAASRGLIERAERSIDLARAVEDRTRDAYRRAQYLMLALIAVGLIVAYLLSRGVSTRAASLAETADRIAAGDLLVTAGTSGGDELAIVAEAFNSMTARLRTMLEEEQRGRASLQRLVDAAAETINSVTSAGAEILAATTQQAAGAQEQASAVTETVSTVDEVLQTSEQAAQRARSVAESSRRSAEISASGKASVAEAVDVIGVVSEQSSALAADILALAEQAQAIGDIISSVSDIAEQTNILALNAAIEASRAGEHGKGFAVVASEVKALSAQSKKATSQVRQILGQIQKATNAAVFATEKSGRSITDAVRIVNQSGETIAHLSDLIEEATTVAAQISASSTQQVTGMAQIHQAMKNIREVTHQNLASTRQSEMAAQDLNRMAGRLKELLQAYDA